MALVKGLTPFTQDRPTMDGEARGGRTAVNTQSQLPGLSPAAQPVDTYVHPGTNGAMRLADSLSALVPSLREYGSVQAAQEQDDLQGKLSAALTGRTLAEQRDILAKNPDFQNKLAQNLGNRMLGQVAADEQLRSFKEAYAAGQIDTSKPLEQYFNPIIQKDLANADPHFAEAYRERMLPGVSAIRDAQAQVDAQQAASDQNDLLFNSIGATINTALDTHASPEATYAAIRQTFLSNKTVSNKPMGEQDHLLVQALAQMAGGLETDPQYAEKYHLINGILNFKRTDAQSGQQVGSLLDSATLGPDARKVLNAAQDVFDKKQAFNNTDALSNIDQLATTGDAGFKPALDALLAKDPNHTVLSLGQIVELKNKYAEAGRRAALLGAIQAQTNAAINYGLTALAPSGTLRSMPDITVPTADGTGTKVVKGEDLVKQATSAFEAGLDQKYAALPNTPANQAARFNEQVRFYASNGLVNDRWKGALDAGYTGATTMVASGGQIPQSVLDGYTLYTQLLAKSPGLASTHVDKDTSAFYENARVFQQYMQFSPQQALTFAAKAATDPTWDRSSPGISKKDLVTAATNEISTTFGTSLDDTWNKDIVLNAIAQGATALNRATGLPMKDAITEAAGRVKGVYAIVNHTAVYTGDQNVPPNFGDMANRYVDAWYDANRAKLDKLGIDKDNIVVTSVGNTNQWALVLKDHPSPVPLPGANFSLPLLYKMEQGRQQSNRAAALADLSTSLKYKHAPDRGDQPWLVLGDPDHGGLVLGGGNFTGHSGTIADAMNSPAYKAWMDNARRMYRDGLHFKPGMMDDAGRAVSTGLNAAASVPGVLPNNTNTFH